MADYLPAVKEVTLVRLLKQVSQVYQSVCFKRLLELAPFSNSFELERVIVDCVRHNDMQIRVDHRTRTVHFGTDLTEAQVRSYSHLFQRTKITHWFNINFKSFIPSRSPTRRPRVPTCRTCPPSRSAPS